MLTRLYKEPSTSLSRSGQCSLRASSDLVLRRVTDYRSGPERRPQVSLSPPFFYSPFSTAHCLTVLSFDPGARSVPSGEKATERTSPLWGAFEGAQHLSRGDIPHVVPRPWLAVRAGGNAGFDECGGMHESRWRRLLPAHRPEHLPLSSSLSCWARYSGSARYHVNSTPNPGDKKNPAPRTLN